MGRVVKGRDYTVYPMRSFGNRIRGGILLLLALAVAISTGCRSLPRDVEPGDATHALEPAGEGLLAGFSRACEERVAVDESCFLPLDLLTAGPVVVPVSAMFDRYWNSPQAVPG